MVVGSRHGFQPRTPHGDPGTDATSWLLQQVRFPSCIHQGVPRRLAVSPGVSAPAFVERQRKGYNDCRSYHEGMATERPQTTTCRDGALPRSQRALGPPPFFAKLLEAASVEPVTMSTDLCAFHVYHHQGVGNR